jgi:hypothetical protein
LVIVHPLHTNGGKQKDHTMRRQLHGHVVRIRFTLCCVLAFGPAALPILRAHAGEDLELVTSSFLGGADYDNSVVGARIQSNGTIVLAANLGTDAAKRIRFPDADAADRHGCIVRLAADGTKALGLHVVAAELKDLAIDNDDNLYLAAGDEGLVKLSPDAAKVIWKKSLPDCTRGDAAGDGHCVALAGGNLKIFDNAGKEIGTAKGSHYTCDVCIDGSSKTVIYCGFRNAHAFDGKRTYPVQICYIRGLAYDGRRKWTDYEWSTDRESDRFLNKPENNMADSRADRCTIGRDGKLYVTFQVAGGNHLFRYSPKNIMEKAPIVGGDKHHEFYNSRAEHKCFFARYEPATGEYLAGQQFCGRLSNNRSNAVVTKQGEITADEHGRVYVVGNAAYGLPLTVNPDGGDYTGGGFILVMSPDLKTRLLCTRTAGGKGAPHAVDVRQINGRTRAVYGGSGMPEGMFTKCALQPAPATGGKTDKKQGDGFFVVIE